MMRPMLWPPPGPKRITQLRRPKAGRVPRRNPNRFKWDFLVINGYPEWILFHAIKACCRFCAEKQLTLRVAPKYAGTGWELSLPSPAVAGVEVLTQQKSYDWEVWKPCDAAAVVESCALEAFHA